MKAITTVGERLRLIKEWQQSGLTVSEWCRRNGIHPNTFCNWIHRSRKQGLLETPAVIPQPVIQDPIQQDIVKIEVTRDPETIQAEMMPVPGMNFPEVPSANNRAVVMEISIGAIRVKANNQVNPKLLAETVRLLGSDATC